MRDYKRLRDALGDLVAHAYECDACYEDRCESDCECSCHEHKHVAMTKARQTLAEIPETSEMERLVEWAIDRVKPS
jgi:hypothetical protein